MVQEDSKQAQINIDKQLIDEGTAQLTSEIKVLESWLNDLDASESKDPESEAARKSSSVGENMHSCAMCSARFKGAVVFVS